MNFSAWSIGNPVPAILPTVGGRSKNTKRRLWSTFDVQTKKKPGNPSFLGCL
ncbi:hypothetical protein J2046_002269 [Rhizobium petrolearium]|nr:hypothetical protein [Neorhizobium petrolearium]